MDLRRASLQRECPIPGLILFGDAAFRRGVQREQAARTVILAAEKPEEVRERGVAPMQFKLSGLQPH